MAFIRIKLLDAIMDHTKPNNPFCAVNVKEAAAQDETGKIILQQHKKTFYPDWNRCFDSHLKPGRRIQIYIMDRADVPGADVITVAEVTVESENLAEQCEDDNAVKIAVSASLLLFFIVVVVVVVVVVVYAVKIASFWLVFVVVVYAVKIAVNASLLLVVVVVVVVVVVYAVKIAVKIGCCYCRTQSIYS